ncbi:MnhB domain-containing protein [Terricaulis silvestris]|uniref:Multisubunit Na+/H+ antiporter, MnhB subunit n=1 Tax=Terricaulis silvestris TaxID=2686094 RepID=A0A6I6MQC3_9CAUL|nr:MnhB domain-containing protein [Terricaulis silvestris]QGZ95608.1 Multisubunit Na+/H+ antiporter, MnhB subunit [Terricaulis silvestris]
MKPGGHIVLAAATRFYAPIIVLAALLLLVLRLPGEGVGFVSGMILGLALAVHVLVFGAAASRAAFPPYLARVLLAGGLALAVVSAAAPRLEIAPQLGEAGVFVVTASGIALILAVLVGRAPTLRDEDS